jgi:hypothetical protein
MRILDALKVLELEQGIVWCAETAFKSAAKININKTIDGICMAVCPWTKRYLKRCLS